MVSVMTYHLGIWLIQKKYTLKKSMFYNYKKKNMLSMLTIVGQISFRVFVYHN